MIRIKNNTQDSNWETVVPTIFPDGTSQVWKLKTKFDNHNTYTIKWNFENEAELIQIAQLRDLLGPHTQVDLEIPYFPYARQDKDVDNEATFAKFTCLKLLSSMNFSDISTYDIHSDKQSWGLPRMLNQKPEHIHKAVDASKPNLIFYPDEGAYRRYSQMFAGRKDKLNMLLIGYGEKVRNQSTGVIESYNVVLPSDYIQDYRVLIVDDLIDGGATFIEATKALKKAGLEQVKVDLCVSHTVSSFGLNNVLANGIEHVYTTNSRPVNLRHDNITVYEV